MEHALNHIAFIPDGNRRFAKEQGIPLVQGHVAGYKHMRDIVTWCQELNIKELSFWIFSTENWKRSSEEVGALMDLFIKALAKEMDSLLDEEVRVRVIGNREKLSDSVISAIESAEESTATCTKYILNIFFNYGGRPEILNAVKEIIDSGTPSDQITEEMVNSHLWSSEISDPDLIIRTSGEQRLSGFLPWQSGYSELYFSSKYWPAFDRDELENAIAWYGSRERRFGGNSQSA